jgi:hypothetical protein
MALLFDTGMYCDSPGPNGLPGGYPVRLSAKGAEVILPEELTLDEAVKMNAESGRLDGIERIEEKVPPLGLPQQAGACRR